MTNQNRQARLQSVLQEVAFGLSANDSQDLFRQLVLHLADTFDVSHTFVALVVKNAEQPTVKTIAAIAHGKLVDNFEYCLIDTPCENVVGKKVCFHSKDIQAAFPRDLMLVDMGVDSYIGAPLFDVKGCPLGLVAALDTRSMREIELKTEMLKIYTLRAARELERRSSDAEIKKKEQRYQSLVSNIPGVVYRCTLDADWTMDFISDGIKVLSGYAATDFIKNQVRSFASIIHVDDTERVEKMIFKAVSKNQPYIMEYRIIDSNGTVHWVYEKGQAQNRNGANVKWIDGVIFDITERKKVEMELGIYRNHLEELVEERTADLQRVNKEMESFSYSVSHDLRAPLRSIDGFSAALIEDYYDSLDEAAQDYLNRIRNGAQRMGELIDDLLMLSRVSRREIKYEYVNLSALAEEIANTIKQQPPRGGVSFNVQPDLVVMGDKNLLRIVFDNLLSNAWKYTQGTKEALIEFFAMAHEGGHCYCIRDNGTGFDMQYVDKLFGVFQRLHGSEFEGTGVGLATAKRVIERHGGRIWGEGELDKGACFCFTLSPPDK